MCDAVIVPDLSANQVGVKALKQFIMVNGFAHSVLQRDGHSGLMKLQDQLPTQISPPYSHQSQGTVERFHKTLYQVRAINSDLLLIWGSSVLIWGFIQIQQQLVSCPGSFLTLSSPSIATSFVRMARHHTSGCSTRLIQVRWFISGKEFWPIIKPPLPPKSFI